METDLITYHIGPHKTIPMQHDVVREVSKGFAQLRAWDLNPKNISPFEFEIVFAISKRSAPDPRVVVEPRIYMVVQHGVTTQSEAYDVELMSRYGVIPTAVSMMGLTEQQ